MLAGPASRALGDPDRLATDLLGEILLWALVASFSVVIGMGSLLLKILAMSASLALARAVSHFLIYKALIISQMPFLRSVPLLW